MSAAFTLDYTGPEVLCDYPRCILNAFHDGEHQFPSLERPQPKYIRLTRAEYSEWWMAHFSKPNSVEVPMLCCCAQRSYPHELIVHRELRSESYNPQNRFRWPWTLMFSKRAEPSTERSVAA